MLQVFRAWVRLNASWWVAVGNYLPNQWKPSLGIQGTRSIPDAGSTVAQLLVISMGSAAASARKFPLGRNPEGHSLAPRLTIPDGNNKPEETCIIYHGFKKLDECSSIWFFSLKADLTPRLVSGLSARDWPTCFCTLPSSTSKVSKSTPNNRSHLDGSLAKSYIYYS